MMRPARNADRPLTRRRWLAATGAGPLALLGGKRNPLRAAEQPARSASNLFVTAAEILPGPTGYQVTWSVLALDTGDGTWDELAIHAGPRLWVAPDARSLAYGDDEGDGSAWLLRGRDDRRLDGRRDGRPLADAKQAGPVIQVVWSPDSREAILTHREPGSKPPEFRYSHWRCRADGSGRRKIPIPETDVVSDWSPDGDWVLTSSRRDLGPEQIQVHLMRPDGRDDRRLAGAVVANSGARFSPDGRRIAYLARPIDDGVQTLHAAVRVMDADGTNPRAVHGDPERVQCRAVCWSPDGQSLAVSAFDWVDYWSLPGTGRSGLADERIEVIPAEGGRPRRIAIPDPFRLVGRTTFDWR